MSLERQEAPADASRGRGIRIALMVLPIGTILLGIGSFGIWAFKKKAVENRAYAYASALRQEMSVSGVKRFAEVIAEVLSMPLSDALPSIAAYLSSSMGAENMGYDVQRELFCEDPAEASVIDVELTGKKRPREVLVVAAFYGGGIERVDEESMALATLMAMAHSVTGEFQRRTVRFAAVPLGVESPRGLTGIQTLAVESRARDERITHVWILGRGDVGKVREAAKSEQTGAIVQRVELPMEPTAAIAVAEELLVEVLGAAGLP